MRPFRVIPARVTNDENDTVPDPSRLIVIDTALPALR